jgi:hypothetical protein
MICWTVLITVPVPYQCCSNWMWAAFICGCLQRWVSGLGVAVAAYHLHGVISLDARPQSAHIWWKHLCVLLKWVEYVQVCGQLYRQIAGKVHGQGDRAQSGSVETVQNVRIQNRHFTVHKILPQEQYGGGKKENDSFLGLQQMGYGSWYAAFIWEGCMWESVISSGSDVTVLGVNLLLFFVERVDRGSYNSLWRVYCVLSYEPITARGFLGQDAGVVEQAC